MNNSNEEENLNISSLRLMYYKLFSCCVKEYAYKIKLVEEIENEVSLRLDIKNLIENQLKTQISVDLFEKKFDIRDHKTEIVKLKSNNLKYIKTNMNDN